MPAGTSDNQGEFVLAHLQNPQCYQMIGICNAFETFPVRRSAILPLFERRAGVLSLAGALTALVVPVQLQHERVDLPVCTRLECDRRTDRTQEESCSSRGRPLLAAEAALGDLAQQEVAKHADPL
jgi:hypothetical protein